MRPEGVSRPPVHLQSGTVTPSQRPWWVTEPIPAIAGTWQEAGGPRGQAASAEAITSTSAPRCPGEARSHGRVGSAVPHSLSPHRSDHPRFPRAGGRLAVGAPESSLAGRGKPGLRGGAGGTPCAKQSGCHKASHKPGEEPVVPRRPVPLGCQSRAEEGDACTGHRLARDLACAPVVTV